MFDSTRLPFIKEKFESAETNLRLLQERIPKSAFIDGKERNAEEEQKLSVEEVGKLRKNMQGLLEKIQALDSREKLRALSIEKKIDLIIAIDTCLKATKTYVENLEIQQYTAKLERFVQVIRESVDDIYSEFTLLLPNISYEVELITRHFANPYNAERTIVPLLQEILTALKKHQISFNEFLNGYSANGKEHQGYLALRVVDDVFSKYQHFENLQEEYVDINAEVYNFCKTLEMYMLSQKGNPDFASLFDRFDEINKRSSGKTEKNIRKMSDIFSIVSEFQKILHKIGAKSSYLAEYAKAQESFKKIQELQKKLVRYDMERIQNVLKSVREGFQEEASLQKFTSIEEEITAALKEKSISFEKLSTVLDQLQQKNLDVMVTEKDAADLVIEITEEREKKYGKDNLMRYNVMVEEVDFWMNGDDKQEMLGKLSLLGKGVLAGEEVNMKRLKMIYNEIEHRIRKNYVPLIGNIGKVIGALEKLMVQSREQARLDERTMEVDVWKEQYVPRVTEAKKRILLLKSGNPAICSVNISMFPFLRQALRDMCQVLYELSMKLYSNYESVDARSIAYMTELLSLFRQYHDILSLWFAFSTFMKLNTISSLAAIEEKVKRLPSDKQLLAEIEKVER